MRVLMSCVVLLMAAAAFPPGTLQAGDEARPLELEAKIPLGDVKGRIDHLAFDAKRRRLFVAELGNDTVGVIDLDSRKAVHSIAGLKEPQGVAYEPSTDTLYVANGGDGTVRLFRSGDYSDAGQIELGNDADNIRVDGAANRVFVGYGRGGLAVIDPAAKRKIVDIPLRAHPESFQLAASGQIFVNLPQMREIAVIDRAGARQVATWPMNSGGNFPMAVDNKAQRVLVAFRNPPALGVFSMRQGELVANVDLCGDADDMFVDARRQSVYVSCGRGFVDVFGAEGDSYRRQARVPTSAGARTSYFVPEIDRFFVAIPAATGQQAEVWVFRPVP